MGNKSRRFLAEWLGLVIWFSALLIFACQPNQKAEERTPVVDIETLKSRLVLETEEDSNQKQFLETGSTDGLDISCTDSIKLPHFRIPKR